MEDLINEQKAAFAAYQAAQAVRGTARERRFAIEAAAPRLEAATRAVNAAKKAALPQKTAAEIAAEKEALTARIAAHNALPAGADAVERHMVLGGFKSRQAAAADLYE